MPTVYLKDGDGKVLLVDGKVATGEDCCCGDLCPPMDAPTLMSVSLAVTSTADGISDCGSPTIGYSFSITQEENLITGTGYQPDEFFGCRGEDVVASGAVTVDESPSECCTTAGHGNGAATVQAFIYHNETGWHLIMNIGWNFPACGNPFSVTADDVIVDIEDEDLLGTHEVDLPGVGPGITVYVTLS